MTHSVCIYKKKESSKIFVPSDFNEFIEFANQSQYQFFSADKSEYVK